MKQLVKPTISISMLCMEYLAVNKTIEQSTAELTERAFRHLKAAVGNIGMDKFSYEFAERFQAWLIETGRNRVTANIYVKAIKPAFNWAKRHEWIESNPFDGLKLFKIPKKRIRRFEPWEFQAIFDNCPNKLWRARVLLGKTSLRRGEVLNLTVDDIDFSREIIYISSKENTAHTWQWHPKNKNLGWLPLIPELNKLLVDLMVELPDGQPYLLLKPQRYWRVLELKRRGRLLDRIAKCPDNNFDREFQRILKRAGVKNGSFHDLRKTAITEWAEYLQPAELQEIARHSNLETTMTYYVAVHQQSLLRKARQVSMNCLGGDGGPGQSRNPRTYETFTIGATGLEPATS